MHVESYCSRKWNVWLDQETTSNLTFVPRRTASHQDGIWAIVLQGGTSTDQHADELPVSRWKDARKMNRLSFYLINFFPDFQTYLHISSPHKKGLFKMNLRRFVRVHNPPSSQIPSHLNKVPIKIRSPSLLVGSGGDRRHERRLFCF